MSLRFADRGSKAEVEEGTQLAPKFDEHGLIPAVTTDHATGQVLMVAFMNDEALKKTIETKQAHYYSRSRKKLWLKGESSGQVQHVKQLLLDCDQDCVVLKVEVGGGHGGASCHVGYKSCFYREVPLDEPAENGTGRLRYVETEKLFDPAEVYGTK
jgi:phosphoribosyl-AMP cyclohydrolase